MKMQTSLLRQGFSKCMALTATVGLLTLSACGDSDVAGKAQELQETAAAVQQASELVKSVDNVTAGSGSASAAELVAEHNIHWTNPFFFTADALGGKAGMSAGLAGHSLLGKLAANKFIERQIRECHEFTRLTTGNLDMLYKPENAVYMKLFDEEKARVAEAKGQYLESDLSNYYIKLIPQYLNGQQLNKTELHETFWQWCITLPVKHFQPPYSDNPISL